MRSLGFVLVLVFMGFVANMWPESVSALPGSDWTTATPTISKQTSILGNPDSACTTYRQDIFITELGAPRSVCVYGDERLKIGTYLDQGREQAVVQFAYSTTGHMLQNACVLTCRYSAETDTLVTLHQISQFGWGLVLYKHASARITRIASDTSVESHYFDTSKPEYEMKNQEGRYIWTPSFGISNNGKWIATELYDNGIAVLNVGTMTARQITTDGYHYGRGMDPSEEVAVSDDGKSVAVVGRNAGVHVYDVVHTCGQPLVGDLSLIAGSANCPSTDLGIGSAYPNFALAERPRFYGNGHQLELIVTSWGGSIERTTFVTKGTPIAHQLKLLSLGDSFSSGEGETDDTYYIPGTNTGLDTCHVSTRAYSALIARSIGIFGTDAKNIACSGARMSDIFGSEEYIGQGSRLGDVSLGLSADQMKIAQEKAIDDFQPGRALQSSFIERYNPEIITIGIGGNDAGLMGKLRTCAMPGTCEWAQGQGVTQTFDEIHRLSDGLGVFYDRIRQESGDARIFVMGYPDIIDPEGVCDPVTSFLFDHAERLFIHNSVQYLDQVIRIAANKAGFNYVATEHSFDGTMLCSGNSSTSMNGVRIGDDATIIDSLPMVKIIGAETFHPTPSGHVLLAGTALRSYPGMESGPPSAAPGAAEASPYWGEVGAPIDRAAFVSDFAHIGADHHIDIEMPSGTVRPYSIVTIEMHSEPLHLATFVADEAGAIKGSAIVPDGLSEGFHTLHMLAINRQGDAVDMYQFVTIGADASLASVGDGEGSDVQRNALEAIKPMRPATPTIRDAHLPSTADVLGVSDIRENSVGASKLFSPITAVIRQMPRPLKWVLFSGFALLAIITLALLIIVFSKKWVKRGS